MSQEYGIRRVTAAETRPLRQEVLRPHQRLEEVGFAGDEAAGAAHFGAFTNSDQLVAISTVHPDEGGWRLRGMATREAFRGRGLGSALIEACVAHARENGGGILWCNARVRAAGLYRRHGFEVRGESFELPGIGPHFYMWRRL